MKCITPINMRLVLINTNDFLCKLWLQMGLEWAYYNSSYCKRCVQAVCQWVGRMNASKRKRMASHTSPAACLPQPRDTCWESNMTAPCLHLLEQ